MKKVGDIVKDKDNKEFVVVRVWEWDEWCDYDLRNRKTGELGFLREFRKKSKHTDSDHYCTVGCPQYSSGHSIDVNGTCNMGCC